MASARLIVPAAAPLVYLLAASCAASLLAYAISLTPWSAGDFNRLVSRGTQVLLLLSLIPLSHRLRITREEFGLTGGPNPIVRMLAIGLGLGLLILSIHVLLLLELGAVKPSPAASAGSPGIEVTIGNALWAGLLVGCIEESMFRGVLLGWLARHLTPAAAAVLSSAYFALLHFLKSELHPGAGEIRWHSGLDLLLDAIRNVFTASRPDSLLALFLAGLFLASVRLKRPHGLAYCIGIHAGWVIVIKTARRLTDPDPQAPWAPLIGSYDQIIGYGAAAWLAVLVLALWVPFRNTGVRRTAAAVRGAD